jgi:hypothetical protein
MQEFIYVMMGSLFSGIIVYVIKGFFTSQKELVAKLESDMNEKIKKLEGQVDKMIDGHADIYHDILGKFSNWEDRIKKILEDLMPTCQVDASDKSYASETPRGPSQDELRKEIIKSFSELDKTVKRDMNVVKRDVDIMSFHLKKAENMINDMKLNDSDKNDVRELLKLIAKVESDKNKQLEIMDEKIVKMFSVCKIISSDNKELYKKIAVLADKTMNRIRLTD